MNNDGLLSKKVKLSPTNPWVAMKKLADMQFENSFLLTNLRNMTFPKPMKIDHPNLPLT